MQISRNVLIKNEQKTQSIYQYKVSKKVKVFFSYRHSKKIF